MVARTLKPYIGRELPELICEKGTITDLEDYIEYLKFEETLKPALFGDRLHGKRVPPEFRKKFFDVELIEKAKGVLKLLSEDLKESKYFSGSSTPNEVDALIFGYLAVIVKLKLPNLNNLQQFAFERRNLVAYVDRIMSKYFPEQEEANKKLNKENTKRSKGGQSRECLLEKHYFHQSVRGHVELAVRGLHVL
ncbi:hypothetical protein L1887_52813 [Cichorium endivia]|nr:hypothetical protein L1887_52813 [Cichorium endivia]